MNSLWQSGFLLLAVVPSLAIPEMVPETPAASEFLNALPRMIRWTGVMTSVFVLVGAWLLLRFSDGLAARLNVVFAEKRLVVQKLNTFLRFGVYLVTTVTVVTLSFQLSNQVLAVIGGTVAVAVGFALKDLAASIVAGILIMLDRPFQVGDRVSFGGEYGDIIVIGLRSVKLRTLGDSVVTIPNNVFLTSVASCGNYGVPDMQVTIDFHIGVDQDVHRARSLVREAAATSRYIYLLKPLVVRVSQVIIDNYVALKVRLRVYVLDTHLEKDLETDITLRVLEAFDEHGIRPPAILHRSMEDSDSKDRRDLRLARRSEG